MIMTFAPALTTTISGLMWAVVNIFLNAIMSSLELLHQTGRRQKQE